MAGRSVRRQHGPRDRHVSGVPVVVGGGGGGVVPVGWDAVCGNRIVTVGAGMHGMGRDLGIGITACHRRRRSAATQKIMHTRSHPPTHSRPALGYPLPQTAAQRGSGGHHPLERCWRLDPAPQAQLTHPDQQQSGGCQHPQHARQRGVAHRPAGGERRRFGSGWWRCAGVGACACSHACVALPDRASMYVGCRPGHGSAPRPSNLGDLVLNPLQSCRSCTWTTATSRARCPQS